MNILGISAYYHDSAACLLIKGDIAAAAQEERFTRKKHDASFPSNSIIYCLNDSKINPEDIDYIVFYEKPFLKFERLLETYLAFAPKGFKSFMTSMPIWLKEKLFQKSVIINELNSLFGKKIKWIDRLLFSEHHLSHAASAFYPSPFKKAAILTMDGVGEWSTTSYAIGDNNNLKILKEINFPHSLGLLYSAFTYYTGFKVNSGEYKLMGLAPYGNPKYSKIIKDNLIKINDDGSFILNMDYFDYCVGLTMTNKKFDALFGGVRRKPESELTQREMDLAASIQEVTEEVVIKLARNLKNLTKSKNLCLAGGVALNCVANAKLLKKKIFENIWVQPSSGDAGGALGAALSIHHLMQKKSRLPKKSDSMKGSYLGPSFNEIEIENYLRDINAIYKKFNDNDLFELVSNLITKNMAVGWMQGRMEFGPRALGARSIIADPRSPLMQKQLNLKVKFRESFRPFAPSILKEHIDKWFEIKVESPYMLLVANIIKEKRIRMSKDDKSLFGIEKLYIPRSVVPAITHVDYSARIQTVDYKTNPRYYELINCFYKKTGCPILVNTSFNIRGEPIVCNVEDAFRCFMGTQLDVLVIENFVLMKNDQNQKNLKNYMYEYELD